MAKTLFISDLHLSPERDDITALFVEFLQTQAASADALYILGDLFEVWLGDDVSLGDHLSAIAALRQLTDSGVPVFYLHGNRDFTVSGLFGLNTGVQIVADPSVIEVDQQRVAICHGDSLCTQDVSYQRFRKIIRQPWLLSALLALPASSRRWLGDTIRDASKKSQSNMPMEVMDVTQTAVEQLMNECGVTTLVHGHTHRPDQHRFQLGNTPAERHVLGDWYTQGSVLSCENGEWHLQSMPFVGT